MTAPTYDPMREFDVACSKLPPVVAKAALILAEKRMKVVVEATERAIQSALSSAIVDAKHAAEVTR